jgi:hypothetical protein
MYLGRSLLLPVIAFLVRRAGEPLRSLFTADQLRALLARYGFAVARDEGLPAIAARLSADLGRDTRVMKHMRVATATRA